MAFEPVAVLLLGREQCKGKKKKKKKYAMQGENKPMLQISL